MSIHTTRAAEGSELVIAVQGRFDFSSHLSFRDAYEGNQAARYTIDMADTTYLDSSALGMLLLLRDHAGNRDATVRIIHCNDDVRKILAISNFDQLFEIS